MVKIFAALALAFGLTFVGLSVSAQTNMTNEYPRTEPAQTTEQPQPTETTTTTTTTEGRSPEQHSSREIYRERVEEKRAEAEARMSEAREAAAERRKEIKAEVCERRQEQLEKVLPRLSKGAETVLERLDTVFERVEGFYAKGQLTVADYDAKVEAIVAAQATATTLVEGLNDDIPTIDCASVELGVKLDTYRSATHEAREALKAYRATLVDLISSLKAAAAEKEAQAEAKPETSTTEGDTQNAQQ